MDEFLNAEFEDNKTCVNKPFESLSPLIGVLSMVVGVCSESEKREKKRYEENQRLYPDEPERWYW